MTSKHLKEIQREEVTAEPSLDQMVDLKDPKVLKGLGKIAQQALDRRSNSEPVLSDERLKELGYTDEQIKDIQRIL
jgi:uracil-DNA glycosylase